jgi:hypothetical protein
LSRRHVRRGDVPTSDRFSDGEASMTDERCNNCRFFRQFENERNFGECRRLPPHSWPWIDYATLPQPNVRTSCAHTSTSAAGWCGEFQQAPKQTPVQRKPRSKPAA